MVTDRRFFAAGLTDAVMAPRARLIDVLDIDGQGDRPDDSALCERLALAADTRLSG